MLLRPPPILPAAANLPSIPRIQATSAFEPLPLRCLGVRSHHAPPPAGARHLLDEMRGRARASSIVRALAGAPRDADAATSVVAPLHCASLKSGAVLDPPVRTSVLTAYARARDAGSALALFREAAAPDLIMWNAAISALAVNSRYDDTVALFRRMVGGVVGAFDSPTLVVMLSGASRSGNMEHGVALHAAAVKTCADTDHPSLWNALIDMYAKCGCFHSSEAVFHWMPCRDTTSWNTMIGGSIVNGLSEVSAHYFREMIRLAAHADEISLSSVISASSHAEDLFSFGESVHGCVIKLGYENTTSCSVANSLITFYSELGFPEDSEKVFVRTSNKNLVSWNAMIKGLVENGRIGKGLGVFREMMSDNQPNVATFVTTISACGEHGLLCKGKSIHGYITRKGLLIEEPAIVNSLLDLYLKCDNPSTASILFKTMPKRDLISWNTMISGYARDNSQREKARSMFKGLISDGLSCSISTLLAVTPCCSCPEDLRFGKAVHSFSLKHGFANKISAVNALMHMYISCGDSLAAFSLMKSILSVSDIVSWNTLIVGCVQKELYREALEAFQFMHSFLPVYPDCITLVNVLSACRSLNLQSIGKSIHCIALRHFLASNVRVKNALLTMYFRFGDTRSSELVFHNLGDRNLFSWNCMISGFVQNKEGWRALQFYQNMKDFAPNEISVVGIICACTQLGDIRRGQSIHGHVVRYGLQTNVYISASLVDMYSKCGRLDIAIRVFESSSEKSIACWNSMISAFGFHGHGLKSIELFSKMIDAGIKATRSTFIALLSACSHSGLVDEGWKYYHLMSEKFGITPTPEHHVCIVDMLGRAGQLQEAQKFLESLPSKQAHGVWGALLSACSSKNEVKLSESIAKHLLSLEPENSGYYVTVSNMYACLDMWGGAVQARGVLQEKGLMKPRGHSIGG